MKPAARVNPLRLCGEDGTPLRWRVLAMALTGGGGGGASDPVGGALPAPSSTPVTPTVPGTPTPFVDLPAGPLPVWSDQFKVNGLPAPTLGLRHQPQPRRLGVALTAPVRSAGQGFEAGGDSPRCWPGRGRHRAGTTGWPFDAPPYRLLNIALGADLAPSTTGFSRW